MAQIDSSKSYIDDSSSVSNKFTRSKIEAHFQALMAMHEEQFKAKMNHLKAEIATTLKGCKSTIQDPKTAVETSTIVNNNICKYDKMLTEKLLQDSSDLAHRKKSEKKPIHSSN